MKPTVKMTESRTNNGWIPMTRQIKEWEWYGDANTFRVFTHILLSVNHSTGKWRGLEVLPGQWVTSINKIAQGLEMTTQPVRTALNNLKKSGEITIRATRQFSVITVVNQDFWLSTNKPDNTQKTNNAHANNQQLTTNKKEKKEKKEDKTLSMFKDFWAEYPKKKAKQRAEKVFYRLLNKEKVPFEAIMEGLRRYIQEIALLETEEQYIKHPAGWLSNHCWKDEYQTIRRMNHDNQKNGRTDARFARKSVTEEARNVLAAIDRGEL